MVDTKSYVTYNEGIEAKHLHLGNLVHDYLNPIDLDPYVEKSYTDLAEVPPFWADKSTLNDYSLTLGKASEGRYHVVSAEKTTKIEIKDADKFFDNVTLKSDEAKKWLLSRLSAADSLIKSHPPPQIWMLTGLILMTHATWTSISSKDPSFTPGQQAPITPTDASQIRRLSVSDAVKPAFGFRANDEEKHVSGAVIHETGKYPGLRGWAARWQKVDVQLLSKDDGQDSAPNHFKLKSSPKTIVLELEEDGYAENKEGATGEDLEDEYWDKFLEKADEYV